VQFGEPLFVRDGLATPSCLHGGTPKARRAVARVGAAIAAPGSTGYRHNKNAFAVSWLYPALIHDNNSCCRGKAEGRRPVRPSHRSPIPPTSGVIGRKIKEFAKSQSDLKNPPPTACRHSVSGSISLPLSGCFSPFPHGTCSLSVIEEYLGLEGGPPTFRQDFSCPALLKDPQKTLPIRGYHPLWPAFPDRSGCFSQATGLVRVRSPLLTESRLMSFATTNGVSVDVLSSSYWDVSVRWVRLVRLCIHRTIPPKRWVAPFGNPRIKAYWQLPKA